jgi:E3 ubiquitin-protein ligase MYLIP
LDNAVHQISVGKKDAGEACLVQVCARLNILEKDYFGLKYNGKHGEQLWVNLRNPLYEQLAVDDRSELELCIKFFVKPRKLLQPVTRRCFYLQLKGSFLSGCWETWEGAVKLASYVLQIEFGDYSSSSHEEYLRCVMHLVTGSDPLSFQAILDSYSQLNGVDGDSAIEQFLCTAHESEDYGLERHSVMDRKGAPVTVSVGPTAIFIVNETTKAKTKFGYSQINCTTYSGKKFEIAFSNRVNGPPVRFMYLLKSKASSLALYRAVTEFHTFFCRETVGVGVKSAGYHTSFFSALKRSDVNRYYFDVLKTHKEVVDLVWPSVQVQDGLQEGEQAQELTILQQSPSIEATREGRATSLDQEGLFTCYDCSQPVLSSVNTSSLLAVPPSGPPPDYSELDPLAGQSTQEQTTSVAVENFSVANVLTRARELEEELQKIKQLMTCHVCRVNPVSATFCPCGHTICCLQCAEQLQQLQCMQCSTQIQSIQRILLS